MFFKSDKDGYTPWLDTADREGLADCVVDVRVAVHFQHTALGFAESFLTNKETT